MKDRERVSITLCFQAFLIGCAFLTLMGCESRMFTRSDAEPPINRQYMELYRTSEMIDRPPPEVYHYPRPPVG